MKYQVIERCNNMKVSELALGCEGFIEKSQEEFTKMIDKAISLGINFIDMYTPNPAFRDKLGAAIKGRRKKFYLQGHIGAAWENGQYLRTRDLEKCKTAFQDQLDRIGTDYIDVGMIHYVDAMEDWNVCIKNGILDYCKELKSKGIIHAIGLSSHNPIVAKTAVETGEIDVLMFSVNAAYDLQPASENVDTLFEPENYVDGMEIDPDRKNLYEVCERENVAIDVMKAFGGGDMLDAQLSPFGAAFTESQCIEYCLTRPAVKSIMAGCRSVEEIEKLVTYYEASEKEKDYASVLAKMERFSFEGNCMYCGHCAPCSIGINIADVNKYTNLCLAQGMVPETVEDHYRLLEHHASECIKCGKCEKNCPFGVSIMEKMDQAVEIFGY